MTCDECGSDAAVQSYDDPDGDGTIALCDRCADDIFGEHLADPECEDCDDEFVDACITAADYMRADEGW